MGSLLAFPADGGKVKLCAVCNNIVRNPTYHGKAEVIKESNVHEVVLCATHKHERGMKLKSLSMPGGLLEYAWQGEGQT